MDLELNELGTHRSQLETKALIFDYLKKKMC